MAKSMSGQSNLLGLMISGDSASVTSSPALEDGPMRSGSPDGQRTDLSGPEVVRVSRSRLRAPRLAGPIRGIFGRRGASSSRSAGLLSCLASKLRQRLDTDGSTVFVMIWKERITPSGRLIYRLRASAPSIDVNGSGSLPTPSGTSNHGRSHVAGRLDEWGGRSNCFRGTEAGALHSPGFELWIMGFPDARSEERRVGKE